MKVRGFACGWLMMITCAGALTACGTPSTHPSSVANGQTPSPLLADEAPQYDIVPIDWENPIDGVEVPSLLAAQSLLPFELYKPQNLGSESKILISKSAVTALGQMTVALLYPTTDYGLVVIKEHRPDVPVDAYDETNLQLLSYNGRPDTSGTFSIVPVRDGTKALMTTSQDGSSSSLFFLMGEKEIIVRGPSLNAVDVVEIANTM